MKAVVFHGTGDTRLDDVREPEIKESTDAIVRLTASAFCGTQPHLVRGTLPGVKPGAILGHEAVGVIEEIGESMASGQGAEVIDFDDEHSVLAIREMTAGIGVDRAIDAVAIDADHADRGPAAKAAKLSKKEFKQELEEIAPKINPKNGNWRPGSAPSQVLEWAVESLAKAETLFIIMGNCNHRKYLPKMVRRGSINPASIHTEVKPLSPVLDADKAFDSRQEAWVKVERVPALSRIAA